MFKGIIEKFESRFLKPSLPKIEAGDVVSVRVWIKEGSKERVQTFEGTAIAIKNRGLNSSFTLRRQTSQATVERVFATHSPIIESVKVLRHGRVRRAKLYYLRKLSGKAARIREKIVFKNKASSKEALAK